MWTRSIMSFPWPRERLLDYWLFEFYFLLKWNRIWSGIVHEKVAVVFKVSHVDLSIKVISAWISIKVKKGLVALAYMTFKQMNYSSLRQVCMPQGMKPWAFQVSFIGGDNKQPTVIESSSQTLSYKIVSSTPHHGWQSDSETLVVIETACISTCKSNYNTIMAAATPFGYLDIS